ncbi:MAG: LacI family DNA-binding transcriptional regulator [Litorivicinaceae bacterium]
MKKVPTLVDVAKLANTSKATAARVFSRSKSANVKLETKARILEAADKLGYSPNLSAASLRSKKTYLIALCIHDITNPSSPSLIRGIQDELAQNGYDLVVFNSDWDPSKEKRNLQAVVRNQLDGLILQDPSAELEVSELPDLPSVILTSNNVFSSVRNTVSTDTVGGVKKALTYLHSMGHERIGILLGGSVSQITNRKRAYLDFYQDAGLEVEQRLIVDVPFKTRASDTFLIAKELIVDLMRSWKRPSAIFASNDMLGLAALQMAQIEGLEVPRDLSVVGMDDLFSAESASPALTSVSKHRFEVGARAAKNLLNQINSDGSAAKEVVNECVECSLVIRDSSGPMRKREA